jgi:uncharacterized protein YkwD
VINKVEVWIEKCKDNCVLSQLIWNDGLALAARNHCSDSGINGFKSHKGTDGSMVRDRVNTYDSRQSWQKYAFEGLSYYSINY